MKPKLFLFSFALFTAIFAYQHAQALPDQVQIVPNSSDQVVIADQKIEVSSSSYFQITSSGPININAPAGFTREPLFSISTGTTKLFEVTGSSVILNDISSVVVTNAGFVGIGTSNPTTKLVISGGNLQFLGTADQLRFSNGQTIADNGTSGLAINMVNNGYITHTSNVGIGTNSPGRSSWYFFRAAGTNGPLLHVATGAADMSLFEVNGSSIVARLSIYEIASQYNNPDYVFSSQYPLMGLSDLKQFVNEKKHLPGVHGSAYIEKHGINLGERAQQLLEKLEESYLYIFNLEERIKKLEESK